MVFYIFKWVMRLVEWLGLIKDEYQVRKTVCLIDWFFDWISWYFTLPAESVLIRLLIWLFIKSRYLFNL